MADDGPRNFREVNYELKGIKQDLIDNRDNFDNKINEVKGLMNELKTSQKQMMNLVFSTLLAPIIVGIIVGYIFTTAR